MVLGYSPQGILLWSLLFVVLCLALLFILNRDFDFYIRLVEEGAATERLTAVFYLVSGILILVSAFKIWRRHRSTRQVVLWVLLGLFFIFIGGEEESWGQWILGYHAPEEVQAVNLQNETNIHNLEVFSLLDPHRVLLLFILATGVAVPLIYRFNRLGRNILNRMSFPVCPLVLSGPFLLAMGYEKVAMAIHAHWSHPEAMEFLFSIAILLYGISVFRGDNLLPDQAE